MYTKIDDVHGWQIEEFDSVELLGEEMNVRAIADNGDSITLICIDSLGDERSVEIDPDTLFPLIGYVEDEE